jgi:choline-glycine betaine transporter
MTTSDTSGIAELARSSLVVLCAASGVVVVVAFYFPSVVLRALPGGALLTVSLVFFGSALAYLAALPAGDADLRTGQRVPYRLRLRRSLSIETVRGFFARQDAVRFGVPIAGLTLFFFAWIGAESATRAVIGAVEGLFLRDLAWLFQGAMLVCVLFSLALLVGPWGEIRLGGPDAEPSYTYSAYFAMVFTAGIAAGIVLWGPAEALFHYDTVPPFLDAEPRSAAASVGALQYTMFHWGLSAWSTYVVIGVPIAYYVHNRDAPLRVSPLLAPVFGPDEEDLDNAWTKLVDILAMFATIGGVATSVALVGRQFLAGIQYQWGVEFDGLAPVLFVAGLTAVFVVSAVSGVRRGIRRLAAVNLILFCLFGLLLAGVGPLKFAVDRGGAALTGYTVDFLSMSLSTGGTEWAAGWTIWYWSWWFSWAPFVGLFLAALSKGRRIRTVALTGAVATTGVTLAWFVLVGGSALALQSGGTDILATMARYGFPEAVAGYPLFDAFTLGRLLSFIFLGLVLAFMVTSADTSTLVVSVLATDGRAPATTTRVFWGVVQGLVGVGVLLLGGGDTLRTVAVLTGGPFAVIALIAAAGAGRTFYREERGRTSVLTAIREALDRG